MSDEIARYCGDCTTPNDCKFGVCKNGKPIPPMAGRAKEYVCMMVSDKKRSTETTEKTTDRWLERLADFLMFLSILLAGVNIGVWL